MKSLLAALLFVPSLLLAQSFMPADHRDLKTTISYPQMVSFLQSVDGKGVVRVSVEGTSTGGRSVYLVRLARADTPSWKILFYAQQHGDEVSGKDALLYLIRDVAANPDLLPKDTAVWIIPMMNPDGAEAGRRVNGAGFDLNRDHITLAQPETLALHRVAGRVRPDIAVDCHEFGRDSGSWGRRGWEKWPDITMDRMNNPIFDRGRIEAADRWMESAAKAVEAAGYRFLRYWVGGVPPEDEQRHSAPDLDSGLNALATWGGLSFIIEASARSSPAEAELGARVDAYLSLFRMFIAQRSHRAEDSRAIRASRSRPFPSFVPVNYLWVNPEGTVTRFPVTETATGRRLEIPTANLMTEVAVKRAVSAPAGYAVAPHAARVIGALLDRQVVPYESVQQARRVAVRACRLLRVEDEFDEVYSRYEGRQIVQCDPPAERNLGAGSLYVPLEGDSAERAALLLEPESLYGLYQYVDFRELVGWDGTLPVLKVVAPE